MPCSHSSNSPHESSSDGLDRREFMKSALAIGGANALRTTENLYGPVESDRTPTTNEDRNNRQHAWDDYTATDDAGRGVPPRHHLLLLLDYRKSGRPELADRRAVEGAFGQLESAFEWSNEGLLFTVGYSTAYFDRFEEPLPTGVDLRTAEEIIDAVSLEGEDPVSEPYEVAVHLAGDDAANLLTAEEALWGFPGRDRETVSDVAIEHTFEGVFDKPTDYPARRTGYVGSGMPRRYVGEDTDEDIGGEISDEAPLSMGFQSGFDDNMPSETAASLVHDQTLGGDFEGPGVFAQGAVQHVSKLDVDLEAWYRRTETERIQRMFSPHHTTSDVGETGLELGATSGTDDLPMRDRDAEDAAERTYRDAVDRGVVGHQQKLARARFDVDRRRTDPGETGTLDVPILRRDFDTTDQGTSGVHFTALMRFNGYMIYSRLAMNGVEFDADSLIPPEPGEKPGARITHEDVDLPAENDGFLDFVTAKRRGNFLVPPLDVRALPPARAIRPDVVVDVTRLDSIGEGVIPVVVRRSETFDPKAELDLDTVRFGSPAVVDRGGGATPADGGKPVEGGAVEAADLLLRFGTDEAGFDEESEASRLFGTTRDGRPVQATTELVLDVS